jgi:hypothetical protein
MCRAKRRRVPVNVMPAAGHHVEVGCGAEQHRMVQNQHTTVGLLRFGQIPDVAKAFRRSSEVQRAKAFIDSNTFGAQGSDQDGPVDAELLRIVP